MRGGCRGGARGGQQPEGRPRARAAPEPADSRSPHGSASHPPQRPDCRVGLCLPWKVQGRACLPGSTRLPPNASGTVPAEQPSRSRLQSQSPAARGTCSQAPCGPGHRAPAPPPAARTGAQSDPEPEDHSPRGRTPDRTRTEAPTGGIQLRPEPLEGGAAGRDPGPQLGVRAAGPEPGREAKGRRRPQTRPSAPRVPQGRSGHGSPSSQASPRTVSLGVRTDPARRSCRSPPALERDTGPRGSPQCREAKATPVPSAEETAAGRPGRPAENTGASSPGPLPAPPGVLQ